MPLFDIHITHHIDGPAFRRVVSLLESNMINTAALLAAVAAEKTESASLRALLAANTAAAKENSAKVAELTAQLAAGNPITADQLAQLQTDIDSAASDLSADNQAAADAITANTITTDAPAAPAAPAANPAPITTDAPSA